LGDRKSIQPVKQTIATYTPKGSFLEQVKEDNQLANPEKWPSNGDQ